MGSSKRLDPDSLLAGSERLLKRYLKPNDRVCLALSGGLDSVALLDVLCRLRGELGIELAAVHVNHQLSANAGAWSEFCAALCRRESVACTIERVSVGSRSRLGVEAAARRARYAVLHGLAADYVALAHHADDQAETVLLQLLRGAGVKGLAAMPMVSRAAAGRPSLIRPFLDAPRALLQAYARARNLTWIEDESNASLRFDRNYLRHEVLPRLGERFVGYRTTFARSARHCAEAAQLLEELAAIDLADVAQEGTLDAGKLRALSPARAKNALRAYCESQGAPLPDSDQLEQIMSQLAHVRPDALTEVRFGGYALRCHKNRVHLEREGEALGASAVMTPWRGEASLTLPGAAGCVTFTPCRGHGLSLERLRSGVTTLRLRVGGERLRLQANRPRRTLKNLLQEQDVPHWRRHRLPLLFCDDRLVWAAGIGVDYEFRAQADEAAVEVEWRPQG